jgi:hypothetical protein
VGKVGKKGPEGRVGQVGQVGWCVKVQEAGAEGSGGVERQFIFRAFSHLLFTGVLSMTSQDFLPKLYIKFKSNNLETPFNI